jgi:hypothetical protein
MYFTVNIHTARRGNNSFEVMNNNSKFSFESDRWNAWPCSWEILQIECKVVGCAANQLAAAEACRHVHSTLTWLTCHRRVVCASVVWTCRLTVLRWLFLNRSILTCMVFQTQYRFVICNTYPDGLGGHVARGARDIKTEMGLALCILIGDPTYILGRHLYSKS